MRTYLLKVSCLLVIGVLLAWSPGTVAFGLSETSAPSLPAQLGDSQAVIVKFASGYTSRALQPLLNAHQAQVQAARGLAELGYTLVRVPAAEVPAFASRAAATPGIAFAQVAQRVATTATIPNDPDWSQQYGPDRVQAPLAWDVTTGSNAVVIAVIDTGVDLGHPDLALNIWRNAGETPGNGYDDDGNGFVDDVNGWNFAYGNNNPQDDNNHGTHVSGIAAAIGNNGIGIAGVAWGAQIMPLKVLSANGVGYDYHVAEAILYAAKNGARVINISLGGASLGAYVEDAVNYAYEHNVTVVAAAGNDGQWGLLYPAAYANVIAVGATTSSDTRAGFSNYGDDIELVAPGDGIYSTVRGGYGTMWGTSMAAPHVAGVAALLAGLEEYGSVEHLRETLRSSARDLGALGRDPYYGYGLVQAYTALAGQADCLPGASGECYTLFLPFAGR